MSEHDFDGRHVVVTGGTGALGSAVVGALLAHGARCHVPVCYEKELEAFPFADHERVRIATGVDLCDEHATGAFYAECPSLWASLQIAGGFSMQPLADTSLEEFRRLLELNATTCFLACREAVRRIRTSAGGGRLVNVTARPVLVPTGGLAAYVASKAAVAGLTQSLGEELAPEGIFVSAVAPSILDTPANRRAMPGADFEAWPKVEEVASAIVFLASPGNATARGALLPVYGRA